MEKQSVDDTLLIDFSSPVSKHVLRTPLIPMPTATNQVSLSPSNANPFGVMVRQTILPETIDNDPFDVMARQTILPEGINNDPFECASNSALKNVNSIKKESFEVEKDYKSSGNVNKPVKEKSGNPVIEKDILIGNNKENFDNIPPVKEKNDVLEISIINSEVTTVQSEASVLLRPDDNGLSEVSGDLSTEEGIKAVIAKRVNNCILKVLNTSVIKSKKEKPGDNNKCTGGEISGKKTFFKKSSSFTTNSTSTKVCDRLNRSCTEPCSTDDSFTVVNHDLNTPESSIDSCDITPWSVLSGEVSKNDESTTENDEVCQEANKLARTFSKIADSFCKNTEEADNDDDLFLCKPKWLYADSSEDEEEKLRKDPALNIRVSFTNSVTQSQPDSEALSALKSRYRRSFTHLQVSGSQDESTLKRSLSIGSKPTIAPVVPIVVPSVPKVFKKHEDIPLKLKKKPFGESRKGPMRAVMPVQSMAKDSLSSGVQSVRNRHTSPTRTKSSSQIMISPIKDSSQINMHPVASSTPNKCNTALLPSIVVPPNKRHSLGESRKSRTPVAETGSRQRSSSANSSIPTSVAVPGVRALGHRSAANMLRHFTKGKVQDKDSDKICNKQTKSNFNPKALNEVKCKIVQPSRVKSTVNAISNMFTGKSKKVAHQDKENRFPA